MDIRAAIRLQNERAKNYCQNCGGNKKIRIATMGSTHLDYEKCKSCNGTGEQHIPKYTAFEKATEYWREEMQSWATRQ